MYSFVQEYDNEGTVNRRYLHLVTAATKVNRMCNSPDSKVNVYCVFIKTVHSRCHDSLVRGKK